MIQVFRFSKIPEPRWKGLARDICLDGNNFMQTCFDFEQKMNARRRPPQWRRWRRQPWQRRRQSRRRSAAGAMIEWHCGSFFEKKLDFHRSWFWSVASVTVTSFASVSSWAAIMALNPAAAAAASMWNVKCELCVSRKKNLFKRVPWEKIWCPSFKISGFDSFAK